jgi:hypothetical protein
MEEIDMLPEQVPIPLPFRPADYDAAGVVAAGIDLDQAAADLGFFSIPFKCQVYLAGAEVVETCAGTLKPIVKFDKRPTAGSDTDRGDGDIGVLNFETTAAGKFLYDKAGRGTVLEPGNQVVVQLTQQPTDAAAGQMNPILLVVPIPETTANMTNAVETS